VAVGPDAFGVGRDLSGRYAVVFGAAGGLAALAGILTLSPSAYSPRSSISPLPNTDLIARLRREALETFVLRIQERDRPFR
jgi:hypothetical protein